MTFVGIIVVFASIIGGYIMEHGNPSVLVQPAEFVIIGGAALGALIISAGSSFGVVMKNFGRAFGSGHAGKKSFLEILLLLNAVFTKAQREGLISLESHLDAPQKSDLFSRFEVLKKFPEVLYFLTDNLRLIITASMSKHDLDSLLDIDIETRHKEESHAPSLMNKMADSFPGLGIVAAVLGVTLAMGKITEPPEVLGHTVAAALVGTFLGVLLCYGIVGPMATNVEHQLEVESTYFQIIKMSLLAFAEGSHPTIAVEAGRRAVPPKYRPSFMEVDQEIRKWKEKK